MTATTALIGKNPPRGPITADRFADFSRASTGSPRVTESRRPSPPARSRPTWQQYPNYAGKRFGNVDIDGEGGVSRSSSGSHGPRLLRPRSGAPSKHQVVDGRLCILALIALDPALASQVGPSLPTCWKPNATFARSLRCRRYANTSDSWRIPGGLNGDELGRRGVATALTDQLQTLVDDHPGRSFLVHIDGAWGAGKSTLLGFVSDEINAAKKARASQPGRGRKPRKSVARRSVRRLASIEGRPALADVDARGPGAVSAIQPRVWGTPWFPSGSGDV